MVFDVMDVNRMKLINNLKPVTSSLYFEEDGAATEDGLFSHSIFGLPGSKERGMRPAYIDLGGYYLNPTIYKNLVAIDRNIARIISGELYCVFNDTKKYYDIVSDENSKASTGLEFLYDNWDKFVFKEGESRKRTTRIELLSMVKRDEAFMKYQVIIPALLRDVNGESKKVSDINKWYKKIISSVSVLESMGSSSYTYNLTKTSIQNTILEIYEYFKDLIRLKNGFLHKSVMGKNIDYGFRTIITAPSFNANKWEDMPADFESAATPLTQCIAGSNIGIQAWVIAWVENKIMDRSTLPVYDKATKTIVKKELHKDWKLDYDPDAIIKRMNIFINTPDTRFHPVQIRFADDTYGPFAFIDGDHDLILESGKLDVEKLKDVRYFTWTDLFYIAAHDVTQGQHILATRYPITTHHSEYFAKIKIQSTFATMNMVIGGTLYTKYPVIRLDADNSQIDSLFIENLEVFPPYIGPLGGDHDGDQVTGRILWSKEANDYVDNYLNSPANIIGIDGRSVRSLGDVAHHTIYNLLRNPT